MESIGPKESNLKNSIEDDWSPPPSTKSKTTSKSKTTLESKTSTVSKTTLETSTSTVSKATAGSKATAETAGSRTSSGYSDSHLTPEEKEMMYTRSLVSEDEDMIQLLKSSSSPKDATVSAIKKAKSKLNAVARAEESVPMELDEYSAGNYNGDEPALVQCLRFYYCGGVANITNAIVDCRDPSQGIEVEEIPEMTIDEIMAERSVTSPKIEVVLQASDAATLPEAPPINLARVPSRIINVTGKHLYLDEDPEMRRMAAATVDRSQTNDLRDEVSVTSIEIPVLELVAPENDDSEESTVEPVLKKTGWFARVRSGSKNKLGRGSMFAIFRREK